MNDRISQPLKVFISYSWDSPKHKDDVLKLADRLLEDGIDCNIDQYEISPPEGWPHWMRNQVEQSNFVLLVCTEQYQRRFQGKEEIGKGKGVTWEGAIINQFIYDQLTNTKFIPVIFSPRQDSYIPTELRRYTYHLLNIENLDSDQGYENLYRQITKQPLTKKRELGEVRSLPPRQRQRDDFKEEQNEQGAGFDSNQQSVVKKKLTELYDRARKLHRARQWKKVIDVFRQMQEENLPYVDPDGLYKLARNELVKEQQQRDQAEGKREKEKRELESLYDQGLSDFEDKNWQEAQRKFKSILQREPSDRNLQMRARDKLKQVQEKLEWEKWWSIGLMVVGWLIGILVGFNENDFQVRLAGGIGGFVSGVVVWWVSQRTKQAEQSLPQFLLFIFIGIGVAAGVIIGWITIAALKLPYPEVFTAIIGLAIALSIILWLWQRQR